MGFFIFGKAHTVLMYGFLHSADIGQVVCYKVTSSMHAIQSTAVII